jgi:hypothetical protein
MAESRSSRLTGSGRDGLTLSVAGQRDVHGGLGMGGGRVDDGTGLSSVFTSMPNSVQARMMTSAPRVTRSVIAAWNLARVAGRKRHCSTPLASASKT